MGCCSQSLTCCRLCWYNNCGAFVGISCACFCVSCLCGAPAEMSYIRGPDICQTGCNQGFGQSCLCQGCYLCPPEWLVKWSVWRYVETTRGKLFDIEIRDSVPDKMLERMRANEAEDQRQAKYTSQEQNQQSAQVITYPENQNI